MKAFISTVSILALTTGISYAQSAYLVSGSGSSSTYLNGYAPSIVREVSPITEYFFFGEVKNMEGKGTLSNLEVCANERSAICLGIGQGDVVANSMQVLNGDVCVIRADLEPEYAFAFTNNSQVRDYSDIRANWSRGRVTMVTSETSSGSLATLEKIRTSAGFDVQKAKIQVVDSWNEVIDFVKSNPRAIGFTVRYPDPTGFLNTLRNDHSFQIMGMAEPALRREKHITGENVYVVNMETPYAVSGYMGFGGLETTPALGSPVVLFGTCPDRLEFPDDVKAVYEKIEKIPAEKLEVELGWLSDMKTTIAGSSSSLIESQGWDWVDSIVQTTGNLLE